jgi:iron complex transport system permease protein
VGDLASILKRFASNCRDRTNGHSASSVFPCPDGATTLLILGSALGLTLATTFGPLASSALAIAAICGAAAGTFAIASLSRRISPVTLLIAGVIGTYVADSGANLLVTLAPISQKAIFTAWNDGNFENITWTQLKIFLLVATLALAASTGLVKALDALVLGERYARSLGHSVGRNRYVAVLGIVALAGSVTAFCGPIAFLDIAVRIWLADSSAPQAIRHSCPPRR